MPLASYEGLCGLPIGEAGEPPCQPLDPGTYVNSVRREDFSVLSGEEKTDESREFASLPCSAVRD